MDALLLLLLFAGQPFFRGNGNFGRGCNNFCGQNICCSNRCRCRSRRCW